MEVKEIENRKYAAANRLAKRRRKKIRMVVLLSSFLILVLCVLAVLCSTVFFPITSVTVSGNSLYENSEIIDASEIKIGDKLFGISEKKTRDLITVRLPYIKNIELKRNLFDNIEILVFETNDVYCYYQEGKYYTADSDNKILNSFAEKPQGITQIIKENLPQVNVGYILEIGNENLELVGKIHSILARADFKIDSLDITDTSAITAMVEGRFSVDFGTIQDIENKTEHLRAMISNINKKNGSDATGKINLSVWTSEKREGYFEATSIF